VHRARGGIALAAALFGCNGNELTPSEFFTQSESIICSFQVECGQLPDRETCRALLDTADEAAEAQNAIDSGRAAFDAEAANACLDALRAQLTCKVAAYGLFAAPAPCAERLTGLVPVGGACFADAECAGDAACDGENSAGSCSAGTCVATGRPPPPAGEGDDCTEAGCAAGLFCLREVLHATCTRIGSEGEPCQGLGTCRDGFACDAPYGFEIGSCVAPAYRGAACDPALDFVACDLITDVCDPTAERCVPRPRPGAPCSPDPDLCVRYAYCDGGICKPKPGLGDFCSDARSAPDCLTGLSCVDGRCVLDDTPACLP
jgi:hypothetical protein